MTLWLAAQLYAALTLACIFSLAALVRYDNRDRRRLIASCSAGEQPLWLFAAELDELLSLPEVEPWERWRS